jgi:hypothetical protein
MPAPGLIISFKKSQLIGPNSWKDNTEKLPKIEEKLILKDLNIAIVFASVFF